MAVKFLPCVLNDDQQQNWHSVCKHLQDQARKIETSFISHGMRWIPLEELVISMSKKGKQQGFLHRELIPQDQTESTLLHRGTKVFQGGCYERIPKQIVHSGLAVASWQPGSLHGFDCAEFFKWKQHGVGNTSPTSPLN